jgi:hypothetical protein
LRQADPRLPALDLPGICPILWAMTTSAHPMTVTALRLLESPQP